VKATARVAVVALCAGTSALVGVDPASARSALRATASFRPMLLNPADVPTPSSLGDPAAAVAVKGCDASAVASLPSVPTTASSEDANGSCVVLASAARPSDRYYLGPAALDGTSIASANVERQPGMGWIVTVRLTRRGRAAFDGLAERQFHKQIAIVSNHAVTSAPVIQPAQEHFSSFGDDGVDVSVQGGRARDARALASSLNDARTPR